MQWVGERKSMMFGKWEWSWGIHLKMNNLHSAKVIHSYVVGKRGTYRSVPLRKWIKDHASYLRLYLFYSPLRVFKSNSATAREEAGF